MATAAAHGLSSFSSYQCAVVMKAVFSVAIHVAAATHAVAVTHAVVITPAAAKLKIRRMPPLWEVSFLYKKSPKVKNITDNFFV